MFLGCRDVWVQVVVVVKESSDGVQHTASAEYGYLADLVKETQEKNRLVQGQLQKQLRYHCSCALLLLRS